MSPEESLTTEEAEEYCITLDSPVSYGPLCWVVTTDMSGKGQVLHLVLDSGQLDRDLRRLRSSRMRPLYVIRPRVDGGLHVPADCHGQIVNYFPARVEAPRWWAQNYGEGRA